MLNVIKDLFGFATNTSSLLRYVNEERKKTRGIKNAVLSEVEFNMELILEHYLGKGVDEEKIIKRLKTANLARALADGFDFTKLKKGKITARMVQDIGFLLHYVGDDCETILKRILHHIEQLQLLPELYNLKDTQSVNARARLINLGKRYLLFTKFLRS